MAKLNSKKHAPNGRGDAGGQMFSFVAPTAKSVQLVGSFTQWQEKPIVMQKGTDGSWQTTVELSPGAHSYRFIVDGQWHDDPLCPLREPNPYGGQNAVRQVT